MSFPPPCYCVVHKRPQSFCQRYRWQITPKLAYSHDPTKSEWADYAAVQAWFGNLSRNKLTWNLSRNIWPQSSRLAEPLLTDRGIKSGISVCKLISTSKKKKKCRQGMNGGTFSQNPCNPGKSHHEWMNVFLPEREYCCPAFLISEDNI